MTMNIFFALFLVITVAAVGFFIGMIKGYQANDAKWYQKIVEQKWVHRDSVIRRIRAQETVPGWKMDEFADEPYFIGSIERALQSNLMRQIVQENLVRKSTRRFAEEEQFFNGEAPDSVFEFEIAVVHPDTFS